MNRPDGIPASEVSAAIARLRATGVPPDVDDEALAAFVEGGIDAVEPASRAQVLRGIGQSPELASVVADLVASAARRGGVAHRMPGRSGWRMAWAACAFLAVSLTVWMVFATGQPRDHAPVALLESGGPAAADPPGRLSDWFAGTPVRILVAGLWVLFCVLAVPAFWTARGSVGRGPGETA